VRELRALIAGLDRRALVVVPGCCALLTFYVYQGHPQFFDRWLAPSLALGPWQAWVAQCWQYLAAVLFLLLLPLAWWRWGERGRLADLGLGLGDAGFGLRITAAAVLLLPPLLWVNAGSAEFQAEYPLVALSGASWGHFAAWQLCYAVYYFAWEFFFRGFVQLGLKARLGVMGAMALQLSASTLLHIGKPFGETMAAVVAGLAFGIVALRTRSFLYLFLIHWYVGCLTDLFCLIRSGSAQGLLP
jgi:membrane protease YdiL (CAAX protease family)